MDEQGFVVIKRERKTPSLAMCQRCKIKFFTPRELSNDPIEAEAFLWGRFNARKCKTFPYVPRELSINEIGVCRHSFFVMQTVD